MTRALPVARQIGACDLDLELRDEVPLFERFLVYGDDHSDCVSYRMGGMARKVPAVKRRDPQWCCPTQRSAAIRRAVGRVARRIPKSVSPRWMTWLSVRSGELKFNWAS